MRRGLSPPVTLAVVDYDEILQVVGDAEVVDRWMDEREATITTTTTTRQTTPNDEFDDDDDSLLFFHLNYLFKCQFESQNAIFSK